MCLIVIHSEYSLLHIRGSSCEHTDKKSHHLLCVCMAPLLKQFGRKTCHVMVVLRDVSDDECVCALEASLAMN